MRTPQFSVIIPALNEEKFVGNLLESLVQQTYKDFEVIVVDGKSKDKTVAVVQSYAAKLPRLTQISGRKRLIAAQQNEGALVACGEWLVFVQADSILMPYFFERVARYIQRYKPSVLTTWFQPDSERRNDALFTLLANVTIEISMMLHRPIAPGPLTIVSRKTHQRIGGYNEEYRNTEDVEYGRRLLDRGYKIHILRETLYVWSLRRYRKEGTLKNLQRFALTALLYLVTKKPQKYISGYDLGGALYSLRKSSRLSIIHKYERRLRGFIKELV